MKLTKDNRQSDEWPSRTVLLTIRLDKKQGGKLNIPESVLEEEVINLVLLACGHYVAETNDVEQFKFKEGTVIRCRSCFHTKLLQDAINYALSNEGTGPGKLVRSSGEKDKDSDS